MSMSILLISVLILNTQHFLVFILKIILIYSIFASIKKLNSFFIISKKNNFYKNNINKMYFI